MLPNASQLKIEIRPIPKRNGVEKFSEDIESFSKAHVIMPFVNPITRKYSTGLSEEDIALLKAQNCPYNLDDHYTQNTPHEFWESSIVKTELGPSPIFLYPGRSMIDFIKWRYLLVNRYIYKSEEEMLTGSKPHATHYIYDEAIEIEIKASKLARKTSLLNNVNKLTPERKRHMLLIINDEDASSRTNNYVDVTLGYILDDEKKSNELEMLLLMNKEEIDAKALVRACIHRGIFKKRDKGYFYYDTMLGFTEGDVVDFLIRPENQDVYMNIKDKMK